MKLILSLLILITLFSFSQTNDNRLTNQENLGSYAMLFIGNYGLGNNEAYILFENGNKTDLLKEKIIRIKGRWNIDSNFIEIVKAFNLLNKMDYRLVSHSCNNPNNNTTACSYIFLKDK